MSSSRGVTPATPTSRPAGAPGLLVGLLDDAAVFPPGNAPLTAAVAAHRALRESPWAAYVGPLLIPVRLVEDLLPLVAAAPSLRIGLIAPALDDALIAAVERLRASGSVEVIGIEAPIGALPVPAAIDALRPLVAAGIPLALEIGRSTPAQLAAIAATPGAAAMLAGGLLRGKYRTGGLTAEAVPTVPELAAVLAAAARSSVPLKFTAGLHHLGRADGAAPRNGVLNLLVAARAAVRGDDPTGPLADPDVRALAEEIELWTAVDVAAARSLFTSFGCCGVTEPLAEAVQLGLLPAVGP